MSGEQKGQVKRRRGRPQREILLIQIAANSRQSGRGAPEGKTRGVSGALWLLSLLICVFAVTVSFVYLDLPVARRMMGILGSAESLAKGLSSAVLLGLEAAVVLAQVGVRITHGRLSRFGETTVLACLTSICAHAINDGVLKPFFGVPSPTAVVFEGARHTFHLLRGFPDNSFPSGHMVLAGAFAGVFMRLNRTRTVLLCSLLAVAAVLLVVGDWHFVSDVIAGAFVGISAGVLAGEVWLAHSK